MKRVGVVALFVVGLAGLSLPNTASAQQYYGQQPYTYGYSYGYDSRPPYGAYGYDWRDAWREHEFRERQERREREERRERDWRRHEWREHHGRDENRWRDRDWR